MTVRDEKTASGEAELQARVQVLERLVLGKSGTGDSDGAFHAALRTFDAQPRMRSDYSVAQNKALLVNWMRRKGYTTPAQQLAYIRATLGARGHGR